MVKMNQKDLRIHKKMRNHKKLIQSVIFISILVVQMMMSFNECKASTETPSGITPFDIEDEIDTLVETYIGKSVQGASVILAKDGKIVFEKGYGYADKDKNIVIDPKKTVFEYGSVTKLFTWVSAMQLEEKGKLDLSKDIRTYLPSDFVIPTKYKEPITMLNLMNHTAGFDDYVLGLFTRKDNYTDLRTSLEENKVKQINRPGTICSYSNYGAGLAGYVVECITNQPNYEYIRKNIFDRLNMRNITQSINHDPNTFLLNNKSKGYEVNKKGNLVEGTWTDIPMYPAGEGNGTIEELAKFGISLIDKESGLFSNTSTYESNIL